MIWATSTVSFGLLALPGCTCLLCLTGALTAKHDTNDKPVWTDPLTRYVHISYDVPVGAPAEVVVQCTWAPHGTEQWQPAKVTPFVSGTALALVQEEEWLGWVLDGRVIERRAAGLRRGVVFNPYPEAQVGGKVDVDFKVTVSAPDGTVLATQVHRVQADNSDVIYLEDWSGVIQKSAIEAATEIVPGRWTWRTNLPASAHVTYGNGLWGQSDPTQALPQLTYPLDLRGAWAIFVCTTPGSGIRLRLTGDERADLVCSRRAFEEVLWKWCNLDRQHLVLKQPHSYRGYAPAQIDYVKLVPLSPRQARELDAQFGGPPDKLVAGFFEPYSWAFFENVQETLQHREPLTAFAEARVGLVDIQVSRFGAKAFYESRVADQLLYSTFGDPVGQDMSPTTDNVGRMQQYTNTLEAELRYARELGLTAHANFGASACYTGTSLESEFSRLHPEWRRGGTLRFEVPEVRQYVLDLWREVLEIGAPGISIDFCRYPECIDRPQTCTQFLRELRRLADTYGRRRGARVSILVRFPAKGVRCWEMFDYVTWVREGLVDYLCPSNLQGRHHHFDIRPYVNAVRGSRCKLLPVVDGLSWGLPMPGPFLWRVRQLYRAGVDGIYVYQADSRVLGFPDDRRCVRMLGSNRAVEQWWQREETLRSRYSKGIYITPYSEHPGYHGWERLRVWVEGIKPGTVEMYLDGKLVCTQHEPPYLLGTEEYDSDGVIPGGTHTLLIRARDGDGWLERTFTIQGAG